MMREIPVEFFSLHLPGPATSNRNQINDANRNTNMVRSVLCEQHCILENNSKKFGGYQKYCIKVDHNRYNYVHRLPILVNKPRFSKVVNLQVLEADIYHSKFKQPHNIFY